MTHAPPSSAERSSLRSLGLFPLGVLALLLFAVIAFFAARYAGERQLLADLPPAQRAALLQSELEAFRLRCAPGVAHRSELDCRERARGLLRFPECGAACKEAVEPFAPAATR